MMTTTNIYAQHYGEEGPTLTPNNLGLVYENAIEKNEDGKVNIHKVKYTVDGIDVVGNVYTPAGYTPQGNYAAIVVAHPNGGSKDQTAGLYAQRLAEAGFVTLAFDARYQGESGGEPRRTDKPAFRIGDISGAVDFIQNYPGVAPERIGAFGICGGGGYTFATAQYGRSTPQRLYAHSDEHHPGTTERGITGKTERSCRRKARSTGLCRYVARGGTQNKGRPLSRGLFLLCRYTPYT